MEQYRRMDNSPSKKLSPGCVPYSKGFGSNLVRRVRKAGTELISKVPRSGRSRSRGRDEGGESPDSSSLGSSSHANDSLDSGSETRRSSPNLPPSPSNDVEGELRIGRNGPTKDHYRKSLPPAINDLFASQILRGSVSSEDVGSLRSGDASDSHQEDSLSTVTAGSGTAELSRAGSRRPVYLTEDSDSIPTRDVGPDPVLDTQSRGRASIRSTSSASLSQQVINRSYNNVHSSLPPVTPRTPTPGGIPRSSTPKAGVRKERAVDDDVPTTPRLPPRADANSAPQVPPRSRRGSSVVQQDTLNSSQSPPDVQDPKPPKPPPRPPPSEDTPLKTGKDIVDNSVWYEYGCV